ncbi:MAG: hypothetical protein AAFR61_20945 [Bacteroidota bacterium]
MQYYPSQAGDQADLNRLLLHHDHLKALEAEYSFMWERQTLARFRDKDFQTDALQMAQLDSARFTSFIIKLDAQAGEAFFAPVQQAYEALASLVRQFFPKSQSEISLDAAHITIKSLLDHRAQETSSLQVYHQVLQPVLTPWLSSLAGDTVLYARGLFTNLHAGKGLTVGVKFYPSTPLVQILRGAAGVALYEAREQGLIPEDGLRPETAFHTMLTHSSGFRVRDLTYPLPEDFVREFGMLINSYENVHFGSLQGLQPEDFWIRNGQSDALRVSEQAGAEVSLG